MGVCVSIPPDMSVSNNRVDRDILDFKWLPDGNHAIVIATDGIKRYIWQMGLTPEHLADGPTRSTLATSIRLKSMSAVQVASQW